MGDGPADVSISRVGPDAVRPLRLAVLRAGMALADTLFEGDDHPQVAHVAASAGGEIVSVGTVFPDPMPWDSDRSGSWRIRGMATDGGWRGQGLGGRVLDALLAHAVGGGGSVIWCHARQGAWDFYARAGFTPHGDVFDDGLAVHRSMWRDL